MCGRKRGVIQRGRETDHVLGCLEVGRRLELLVAKQDVEAGRAVSGKVGRVVNERLGICELLAVELEKGRELIGLADRDEERAGDAGTGQTRRLLLPGECVVPTQGSSEVTKEHDHCFAVCSDHVADGLTRATSVDELGGAEGAASDTHVVHRHALEFGRHDDTRHILRHLSFVRACAVTLLGSLREVERRRPQRDRRGGAQRRADDRGVRRRDDRHDEEHRQASGAPPVQHHGFWRSGKVLGEVAVGLW